MHMTLTRCSIMQSGLFSIHQLDWYSKLKQETLYFGVWEKQCDGDRTLMKAYTCKVSFSISFLLRNVNSFTLYYRYVRTKLAGQMRLRAMPEIRFFNDDAAEQGEQVSLYLEPSKLHQLHDMIPRPGIWNLLQGNLSLQTR